jgi:ribonucleoside-diphosphate reductase alpha chain
MGEYWHINPQRALANNSAVYTELPSMEVFMSEWMSLYESKCGERGIFSRMASDVQAARNGRREPIEGAGCNPCSEIILRPSQFCNLSEVVIRPTDTLASLKEKVRVATILGSLQATLTDFKYIRKIFKKNTEEEALLGVSLTGVMDHAVMSGLDGHHKLGIWLKEMKQVAIDTNIEWAKKLGINQSVAITCGKPSGTVSQLVDSASGIHPRYSDYYIRRVRSDVKDPLAQMMKEEGFPCEDDNRSEGSLVFSFPIEAPANCITRDKFTALEQLELWKLYQEHWCEHKTSITVYYKEEEFLELGAWVMKNFDCISGISFLPHTDHIYEQAPYEEITKQEYNKLVKELPTEIDWGKLAALEENDNTTGVQELACQGGACEL